MVISKQEFYKIYEAVKEDKLFTFANTSDFYLTDTDSGHAYIVVCYSNTGAVEFKYDAVSDNVTVKRVRGIPVYGSTEPKMDKFNLVYNTVINKRASGIKDVFEDFADKLDRIEDKVKRMEKLGEEDTQEEDAVVNKDAEEKHDTERSKDE